MEQMKADPRRQLAGTSRVNLLEAGGLHNARNGKRAYRSEMGGELDWCLFGRASRGDSVAEAGESETTWRSS